MAALVHGARSPKSRPQPTATRAAVKLKLSHYAQALGDEIAVAFRTRPLSEWRDVFAPERFPWAPFQRVDEFVDEPQVVANGYVDSLDYDAAGTYCFPTGAVQFDEQTPNLRRAPEHA